MLYKTNKQEEQYRETKKATETFGESDTMTEKQLLLAEDLDPKVKVRECVRPSVRQQFGLRRTFK